MTGYVSDQVLWVCNVFCRLGALLAKKNKKKTSTPTPRFETVLAFSVHFSISLARFVKMTWDFNVQRKFYEPTPSAHPWISSQPGFMGFSMFSAAWGRC